MEKQLKQLRNTKKVCKYRLLFNFFLVQNNKLTDNIDLKTMELSSSGFSSSIMQVYWNAILNCYYEKDDNIRFEASQVIWQTLSRGLIMPGSAIPTLIAMSTDILPTIRLKIESLIKDIEVKYPGIIAV